MKPNFCRVSVLVWCCAANQYSEIACIFLKNFKKLRTLQLNETKLTSRNASMFNLLALESEKELKKDERTLFWGSPRSLGLSFNTQSPNDAYWSSFGLLQFQPFCDPFLLLLEKKINFIKLCTKFRVNEAKSLPCKCISLVLRSKPVQRNCLYFFKNFKNSARSKG